jgi:hypothetical protein
MFSQVVREIDYRWLRAQMATILESQWLPRDVLTEVADAVTHSEPRGQAIQTQPMLGRIQQLTAQLAPRDFDGASPRDLRRVINTLGRAGVANTPFGKHIIGRFLAIAPLGEVGPDVDPADSLETAIALSWAVQFAEVDARFGPRLQDLRDFVKSLNEERWSDRLSLG